MVAVTEQDLLRWAVLNSATANEDAPARAPDENVVREPIDPKWVDVILGKSDSVRMRECMQNAQDESLTLDERIAAFDELEMLVESIDNANDLRPLGLWTPILDLLQRSPEPRIRAFAVWVMSTAVQNNPTAQKDFLDAEALPVVLRSLETDPDLDVRAKAVTCISGLTRHNPLALAQVRTLGGLRCMVSVLRTASPPSLDANTDPDAAGDVVLDHRARKRALFFLTALVETEEDGDLRASLLAEAERDAWADAAAGCLRFDDGAFDTDLVEKALGLLIVLRSLRSSSVPESVRRAVSTHLDGAKLRDGGVDPEVVDQAISLLSL